ncbi:MAG TPA: HAD-IA family hydrolase [Terriglobales bacterium]|nr:HAD-IA family hydrolase [Terriglobales bacterium]
MVRSNRNLNGRPLKLLIFDLDGTLIDSRADLVNSVNATLRHFQRPELPPEIIATYVGDGAPMLMRRALGDPLDEVFLSEALGYFLSYYRVHKLDHTHAYPGVPEMLAALRRGRNGTQRRMSVLSNKPVNPSRQIVEALGLKPYFDQVYGGNSFPSKKPDPEGARNLMAEAGASPEETVIIGDSSIDVLTGQNAGTWTCGVTYGFAPQTLQELPPDVLVDSPQELAEALG